MVHALPIREFCVQVFVLSTMFMLRASKPMHENIDLLYLRKSRTHVFGTCAVKDTALYAVVPLKVQPLEWGEWGGAVIEHVEQLAKVCL